MIIWDITICTGCRSITHLAGSYGATEIKEGDVLNLTDNVCKRCLEIDNPETRLFNIRKTRLFNQIMCIQTKR